MIVDLEDPFRPPIIEQELQKSTDENGGKYRAITLEAVTCPEDHQPTLICECGECPKFVRRYGDRVFHRL